MCSRKVFYTPKESPGPTATCPQQIKPHKKIFFKKSFNPNISWKMRITNYWPKKMNFMTVCLLVFLLGEFHYYSSVSSLLTRWYHCEHMSSEYFVTHSKSLGYWLYHNRGGKERSRILQCFQKLLMQSSTYQFQFTFHSWEQTMKLILLLWFGKG